MSNTLVIIGAGPMAQEYAKILKSLEIKFEVVGRSQASCDRFKAVTGVEARAGGFEKWNKETPKAPGRAIVAVSEENLGTVVRELIEKGCPSILVEKPGAAVYEEIEGLATLATSKKTKVFVGYNRRFYTSVQMAKELIAEDGGVDSFFFEFTEWGHVIEKKVCPDLVKEEWLWHNSTHVMDLAFYLGGFPTDLKAFKAGSLDWHKRGSKYAGSGVTQGGALFSYMANWAAPGRWVVEIITKKHRFIFKPLEKLQVQKIGSVAVEEHPLDLTIDTQFKPGLYKQVQAFLKEDTKILPDIHQQAQNMHWYQTIEKGS